MPERDGYIPGVPCWIDTSQPDPEAAVDFYRGLFGWEFEDVMPPDSPGKYFIARIRGGDVAAVGSIPEAAPPLAMWNTYVWVESADEPPRRPRTRAAPRDGALRRDGRRSHGRAAGSRGRRVLRLAGEGAQGRAGRQRARLAQLQRTEHARPGERQGLLRLGVRLEDPGPRAAAARCGRCPVTATTSRRATQGFASRSPRSAAPRASRTSSRSINPIPDDQPDTPAHWSVTFGVDDADEIAAKAPGLGAKVVVPPMDAPWVRMTVIEDPQGATFIASQFVLENKDLAAPTDSAAAAS